MKKLIAALLIFFIIIVFSACSNTAQNIESTSSTQAEAYNEERTVTEQSSSATQITVKSITIIIDGKEFSAQLYDNETAQAFAKMLPITFDMQELNGNEKYYYMNSSLPTDSSRVGKINKGDIMLYGDDCLVLFYDSFATPYSYTKIGKIDNSSELTDAVGSGNVSVEFQINN